MYNAIWYIIPGLINLRKGFLVGLINGGAYIRGGGGGICFHLLQVFNKIINLFKVINDKSNLF